MWGGSKNQEQNQEIWPESQRRTEMPFTKMGMPGGGGSGNQGDAKDSVKCSGHIISLNPHNSAETDTISHFVG